MTFSTPAKHQTLNAKHKTKHFIHISCFDEQAKNIQGMLRAIHILAQERQDFHVTLVGTGADFAEDKAYAESLGLVPDRVSFTGELSPKQVAQQLSQANAMLLFSNYENAPVVISEAFAMGIPVLSTQAGGVPEMINTSCGVLVETGNEVQMAQTMKQFMEGTLSFNSQVIREYGRQYSMTEVGKNLVQLYMDIIRETRPNE